MAYWGQSFYTRASVDDTQIPFYNVTHNNSLDAYSRRRRRRRCCIGITFATVFIVVIVLLILTYIHRQNHTK